MSKLLPHTTLHYHVILSNVIRVALHHLTIPPPDANRPRQLSSLQDIAGDILTVMRLRVKLVLDFLETSPGASGGLLASLDADTCQWVRSARDSAAVGLSGKEAGVGAGAPSGKVAVKPLTSAHEVLVRVERELKRELRYKV